MIKVDGRPLDIDSFPDGSILFKYEPDAVQKVTHIKISWYYESDREFLALYYLVKHLRAHDVRDIYLYMPYIPNARMDRVKNPGDIFTLKYFAELLNSLEFSRVEVLDPHSSVSEALINNLVVTTPEFYIMRALADIGVKVGEYINHMDYNPIPQKCYSLTMFYPDSGAAKRYSDLTQIPHAYGIKKRNWETGVIEGLEVSGAVDLIEGRDILIVDDICSRGGTFLHSAKKLKELGARNIYLYVSHCENTILDGELLTSGLIKKVYTTNSIFTKSHDLIEVLK